MIVYSASGLPGLNSDDWRLWVEHADRDRLEAEEAYSRGSWSEACFHAQQSCEKLLKALLLREGMFLPLHDLGRLMEEASTYVQTLEGLLEEIGDLTIHYYASRYPDAAVRWGVEYDEAMAERCLEAMRRLWSTLKPHL